MSVFDVDLKYFLCQFVFELLHDISVSLQLLTINAVCSVFFFSLVVIFRVLIACLIIKLQLQQKQKVSIPSRTAPVI